MIEKSAAMRFLRDEIERNDDSAKRAGRIIYEYLIDDGTSVVVKSHLIAAMARSLPLESTSPFSVGQLRALRATLLNSSTASLQFAAISLFSAIGTIEDVKAVEQIARGSNIDLACHAIDELRRAQIARPKVMIDLLLSDSKPVRESASRAVLEIPDKAVLDGINSIIRQLRDEERLRELVRLLLQLKDARVCDVVEANRVRFEQLMTSTERKDLVQVSEDADFGVWRDILLDLELSRHKGAANALFELSEAGCGADPKCWQAWWDCGNRPLWRGATLVEKFLEMVKTDAMVTELAAYQGIVFRCIGISNAQSIIHTCRELYRDKSLSHGARIQSAAISARLGDSEALEFISQFVGDRGAVITLRTLRIQTDIRESVEDK